jgi:dihydroneopterin aldolase
MQKTDVLDKIRLESIKSNVLIGVLSEERVKRRPIIIDIACYCDLSAAVDADDIKLTIDYAEIIESVFRVLRGTSFYLIEALASAIAKEVLAFPGVQETEVKVTKPDALPNCAAASVEIRRRR